MKLKEAIDICHNRSAVRRISKPNLKYWKNHPVFIFERVPVEDRDADDWVEYDPRDDDNGSLFMYND